jgi:hypothetical protein
MKKLIVGILCSVWLGVLSVGAQCAAKNEAIQPGECLTYELKFNWKFYEKLHKQLKRPQQLQRPPHKRLLC